MSVTTAAPRTFDRSLAQRRAALEIANDVRFRRAKLKRDLKVGRRSVLDVLAAPPEWVGTMKIHELLMAVPKVGRVKASQRLTQIRVSPSKTVGGLSDRQRRELIDVLARRG